MPIVIKVLTAIFCYCSYILAVQIITGLFTLYMWFLPFWAEGIFSLTIVM